MTEDWLAAFPPLEHLESAELAFLRSRARKLVIPAGTEIFYEGSPCPNYLMVVDGTVRVQKVGETGREIVLYRVGPGQTCVITTVTLLTKRTYNAQGITETEVTAVAVEGPSFHELMSTSEKFRAFVMDAYSTRIADLLLLIEEVAFGRVDIRLGQLLTNKAARSDSVEQTHSQLAIELGTAREVVSRQLKDFERRGWVELGRGKLVILDRGALEHLAARAAV